MDKHLNEKELRLQSLIEAKSFKELSNNEKSFVLSMTSEKEYALQRLVVVEAEYVHEDEGKITAPPFVVVPAEKSSVWFKKVPAYYSVIGMAAVFLLMFFVDFSSAQNELETVAADTDVKKEIQYVTQVDTVFEKEILHDTVIQYIDKPVYIEKVKYVNQQDVASVATEVVEEEEPEMLTPMNSVYIDVEVISGDKLGGVTSFANDETNILTGNFILAD